MTRSHFVAATILSVMMACSDRERSDASGNPPMGSPAAAPQQEQRPATEQMAFDQIFIDNVIEHHQQGEKAGRIAIDRAQHAELKSMAQEKIATDEAQVAQLKEWRRAWYGLGDSPVAVFSKAESEQLPGASSTKEMAAHLDMLKSADPFDLAFIDAMIPHHQGAVEMAKAALDRAQHPEIKSLAATIARDEGKAIDMMREWRDAWYPNAQAMGESAKP